jgi:hypothetical protein
MFMKQVVSIVLNLCLGLFLADALVSLLDDTLVLLFGSHLISAGRALLAFLTLLMGLLVYGLMGLSPLVPKRFFLPVALFNYLVILALLPLAIYFYGRLEWIAWAISLGQVVLGLGLLWLMGGWKPRWPLVEEKHLGSCRFSWPNLLGFVLVNGLVLLPATVAYVLLCVALAVAHLSDGFLVLRPDGLTVRVREYAGEDGRRVRLIPMVHVGNAGFYQQISQSFPSNSIILMEGVMDSQGLLTNELTYERMATAVGLEEQEQKFEPVQGELVPADVDISQFSTNTIGFLNLVTLVHSQGLNARNARQVMLYRPPPRFEAELFEDLIVKRNRRVLDEIQARLAEYENIMVPWGAAHIPGIARELQKSGFRLVETREYQVIRFGPAPKKAP